MWHRTVASGYVAHDKIVWVGEPQLDGSDWILAANPPGEFYGYIGPFPTEQAANTYRDTYFRPLALDLADCVTTEAQLTDEPMYGMAEPDRTNWARTLDRARAADDEPIDYLPTLTFGGDDRPITGYNVGAVVSTENPADGREAVIRLPADRYTKPRFTIDEVETIAGAANVLHTHGYTPDAEALLALIEEQD